VPLPLSDALAFVVVVPDRDLATPEARGVLPEQLSREDAVFNLNRMGLLVAGLADPAQLRPEATADRIHEPFRTALFPEAPALLQGLIGAGALAASWSGAGPSLIGFVVDEDDDVDAVRAGAEAVLAVSGVPGRVMSLRADRVGLVTGDEAVVTP
jgi:homoserine kinase